MTQGIYMLTINDKHYVGKDTQIHVDKRYSEHMRLLETGKHYNPKLQHAYNKHGTPVYTVLELFDEPDLERLTAIEVELIAKYNAYSDGYNLTTGGEGMGGFKASPELLRHRSEVRLGEKHPLAKISDQDALHIFQLCLDGKSNKEIAELYGLHDRYVSLIRHKKRYPHLWVTHFIGVTAPASNPQNLRFKTEEDCEQVRKLIREGLNNMQIHRITGLWRQDIAKIRKEMGTSND